MLKVGLGDGEEAAGKRRGSVETEGEARASLWGRTSRSLVWKAVALVLAYHPPPRLPPPPCPSPLPPPPFFFPGRCSPTSVNLFIQQTCTGPYCVLPTFWDQAKKRGIIIPLEKPLIHLFLACYVKHGPPGPMLHVRQAAKKILVG